MSYLSTVRRALHALPFELVDSIIQHKRTAELARGAQKYARFESNVRQLADAMNRMYTRKRDARFKLYLARAEHVLNTTSASQKLVVRAQENMISIFVKQQKLARKGKKLYGGIPNFIAGMNGGSVHYAPMKVDPSSSNLRASVARRVHGARFRHGKKCLGLL